MSLQDTLNHIGWIGVIIGLLFFIGLTILIVAGIEHWIAYGSIFN